MAHSFDQDDHTSQAKAVVALFSRISDLHNVDAVVRALSKRAQDEVLTRVGWLNLFNPLKPAFAYVVPLTFWDNRTLVATLLEMGKAEADGQVKEDPRTDVAVADLQVRWPAWMGHIPSHPGTLTALPHRRPAGQAGGARGAGARSLSARRSAVLVR